MDGNFQLPPPQPDRVISGEMTGIVGGGGGGEPSVREGYGDEASGMMAESMSTEWTDEKHSLYLSSIETSFVNQLYNHEYSSKDLLNWVSRTQNDPNSSGSQANSHYSGQFKVLRQGCWENIKFRRPQTRTDIENEVLVLAENPWIQHFRSAFSGKMPDLSSSGQLGNDELPSQAIHFGSQSHGLVDFGETMSSKKFSARCVNLYWQDSVGSSAEVSDQNFVDRECEGVNQANRVYKKKRNRMTVSDAKDQVVPFEKSPVDTHSNENCGSLKTKDAECSSTKTAKLSDFMHLEPKPSVLKSQEIQGTSMLDNKICNKN